MILKINTKFLWFMFLTLILAVLALGCSVNSQTKKNSIKIQAKPTKTGIKISFNYIPKDITRIFIYMGLAKSQKVDGSQIFSDIRGNTLDQIKKSKQIDCPFVQKASQYSIMVFLSKNKSDDSKITLSTNAYSGGGIRPVNKLCLNLNHNNTGVSLSAAPVFSKHVAYANHKYNYNYNTTVKISENLSLGYGENIADSLNWSFLSAMKKDLKKQGRKETGTFSAFVTVFCNLIHDNITWNVGIAQTRQFMISL